MTNVKISDYNLHTVSQTSGVQVPESDGFGTCKIYEDWVLTFGTSTRHQSSNKRDQLDADCNLKNLHQIQSCNRNHCNLESPGVQFEVYR